MRTLTRYASIEFLKVFLITLTGMTIFMFVIVGGREAVRNGLGPGPILRVMPYILPESMRYSIPTAALLAACMVFGRMSGDNEIVAAKSLGISPLVLIAPALVTAFLISLLTVWINDVSVSWGLPGKQRTVIKSIEEIVYSMLRTRGAYKDDRFAIAVLRVEGQRLILPRVTFFAGDGKEQVSVTAREAQLHYDEDNIALSVHFTDGTFEGPGGIEGALPGTEETLIPLTREADGESRNPSDYPLSALRTEQNLQRVEIRSLEGALAAEAAYQMLTGDVAGLADRAWEERNAELNRERYRLNRLQTEPWRRWANGFSSFFFVLVGVPLSIRRRNSDFMTSFFLSFLPILLVYYPAMMYGVDRAKDGALPQYAVWSGNVICGVCGIWLLRRVIRF
jgi:lipopolysaccharide export system permease protein